MREKIIKLLREVIGHDTQIDVSVPDDKKFGDYSTTVAFRLAKIEKDSPLAVAERISAELVEMGKDVFLKIEVVPPGFINFYLSEKGVADSLAEILKLKEKYGGKRKQKESVSLDYLDANPTGPIHLGHARSGFFGDVLSNVLEFRGYKVSREFYVNNAHSSGQIKSLGKTALGKGSEYRHEQLLRILKSPAVKKALKKMKSESDAGFYIARLIQKENEKFLKQTAKINFDLFFEEDWVYQKKLIEKVLMELRKRRAIYEKDGATWLKAKEYGDSEDRVIVRSDGAPTYVLPDIAYHLDRLAKRKFTKAIDIFGADHHGYGPRLKGALKALGIDPKRTEVLIAQTVRLTKNGKEYKMSKRKGVFVTLAELIKQVGLDVTRFFFLTTSLDTHFDFDLALAKERSMKNPVYYVEYAYVRAKKIIAKVKVKSIKADLSLLSSTEDRNLILELGRFPEVLEDTAKDYHVHRLTRYGIELARAFHNFYEKERVVGGPKDIQGARLALVAASVIVLENLFALIGITPPKRM